MHSVMQNFTMEFFRKQPVYYWQVVLILCRQCRESLCILCFLSCRHLCAVCCNELCKLTWVLNPNYLIELKAFQIAFLILLIASVLHQSYHFSNSFVHRVRTAICCRKKGKYQKWVEFLLFPHQFYVNSYAKFN